MGADALRLFHLFAGPPGDNMDWTDQTENVIEGCGRFLDRVWRLTVEHRRRRGATASRSPRTSRSNRATHRLIAKVSDDIERWSFNTAVAACMEFSNESAALPARRRRGARTGRPTTPPPTRLLLLLAPLVPACGRRGVGAPARRGGHGARRSRGPRSTPIWPAPNSVTMVVQVNGKVRDRIEVSPDITEEDAVRAGPGVRAGGRGAGRSRAVAGRGPAAPARQLRRLTRVGTVAGAPRCRQRYEARKPASSSWMLARSMRYGA